MRQLVSTCDIFIHIKHLHVKHKNCSHKAYVIDIPGSDKKIRIHNINQKINLTKATFYLNKRQIESLNSD